MKIVDLIKNSQAPFYSLEFFPHKDPAAWPDFFVEVQHLQKLNPLFASVTYGAGGGSQNNTLEIAIRLSKEMQICPMPHLTCVGSTKDKIRSFLSQLEEHGIDNILALRGDAPKTKADGSPLSAPYDWSGEQFKHASDLIAFIKHEFPQFGIGAACYPTPHPESSTFKYDRKFTALKLAAGAEFLITQLFFDVREYIELVDVLARAGSDKPVLPGVFPIASLDSVRHILSLCGGHIPAQLYLALEKAHNKGGSQAVAEVGTEFAIKQIRQLIDAGAPGIHLYTLNKSELCLNIAAAVGKL